MKAVLSRAPLPRRPCKEESPCSLGGGVLTPQTTSFPGRLTGITTLNVTTRLRRRVSRLTRGLTVAELWKFASGSPACSRGAFRIAATGTVTITRYHRHHLYLNTGLIWTICNESDGEHGRIRISVGVPHGDNP